MPRVIILAFALLAVCLFGGCEFFDPPLQHSESDIRVWLLSKTPVGSNRADIRALLVRHRLPFREDKGSRTLSGTLGFYDEFQPPHTFTAVMVDFEFDRKDHLTDVSVAKGVVIP